MNLQIKECHISESGNHEYNINLCSRDDMGFYMDCIHCHKTKFFECDTEDELEDLFGINDDDDGRCDSLDDE